jgi:CarD family transcriptional regulator
MERIMPAKKKSALKDKIDVEKVETSKKSKSGALDFTVGDKLVYPAHGVGVLDDIQVRSISGTEQKFYKITIIETGMKIMVPLSQVESVGIRKVVDEDTIEKVFDILRDKKVTIDTQTWNRRFREYSQKIKTGSVFEIASVIRDLSVLQNDKELSFGEKKMLDTAQGLLVKEISIAKSKSEEHIRTQLAEIFEAAV